ncbi:SRPBCC family protein [Chryseobacterium echinoideorum]|uniref:SRPBCC family protein n=1 Tax=Chryseobacterium echinoideorum TaxID=1549648 RepID=UPI0011872DC6|nr:SRPBCC domain-containing protein [Chryseobacterium echinoideorum]
MNKPLIVNKEKVIDATQQEIWEVITTPKYFKDWMLVPAKAEDEKAIELGSKIYWTDDNDMVYLEGEVIAFVPNTKLVISLKDISWEQTVPKDSVTYEFHLAEAKNGTLIKFLLGDLSIDPEGSSWYRSYKASDEIGSIEKVVNAIRKVARDI